MENQSKPKILFIGPIPPEVGGKISGGVATYCWELAQQVSKNGFEVFVLTDISSSFNKDGIKVIGTPSKNTWTKGLYGLISYLVYRRKIGKLNFLTTKQKIAVFYQAYLLKEVLKYVKPDLIHVLHILDNAIFSLSVIRECLPVVVTEHGIGLIYEYKLHKKYGAKKEDLLLRKVNEALKRVNYVISVSQFSKSSLLNNFAITDHVKVKAILNPINTNKLPLLDRETVKRELSLGKKKIIAFCGVHLPIERKGLDILLKAVAGNEYLRKNCRVLVITNEEAKIFAQKFAKEKNIDGVMLGPQPWEMLVKYFNAADIFVMPSRQEGIGLVYYEALLVGVPVVGFIKSIEELKKVLGVYIGEGFDASKESKKNLAEKIMRVLSSNIDRRLLRKKMVDNLSWDVKFNEFGSFYREILESKF